MLNVKKVSCGATLALAVFSGVACGATDTATSTRTQRPEPKRRPVDDMGSGALTSTKFVVPSVVTLQTSGRDGALVVYARLNRDLPRGPDGQIRAQLQIAGIDDTENSLFTTVQRRHCFSGGVGFDGRFRPPKLGERVEVVLMSQNARGETDGTLGTTARVIKAPDRRPDDYSPDPIPRRMGCGKPDSGI